MNAKKAKAIRRLAKTAGHYQKDPAYRVKEVKKLQYYTDKEGNPQTTVVSRFIVYNTSRYVYRRMKQSYKNGELAA